MRMWVGVGVLFIRPTKNPFASPRTGQSTVSLRLHPLPVLLLWPSAAHANRALAAEDGCTQDTVVWCCPHVLSLVLVRQWRLSVCAPIPFRANHAVLPKGVSSGRIGEKTSKAIPKGHITAILSCDLVCQAPLVRCPEMSNHDTRPAVRCVLAYETAPPQMPGRVDARPSRTLEEYLCALRPGVCRACHCIGHAQGERADRAGAVFSRVSLHHRPLQSTSTTHVPRLKL